MNIQNISSIIGRAGCQPIRNQNFSQASVYSQINDTKDDDIFTPSDPYTQEQKLDLACRLAAYYQTQYANLQQKTGCYA